MPTSVMLSEATRLMIFYVWDRENYEKHLPAKIDYLLVDEVSAFCDSLDP